MCSKISSRKLLWEEHLTNFEIFARPEGYFLVLKQLMRLFQKKDKKTNDFLRIMTLCNRVALERDDQGQFHYHASSPDEEALVRSAAMLGFKINNQIYCGDSTFRQINEVGYFAASFWIMEHLKTFYMKNGVELLELIYVCNYFKCGRIQVSFWSSCSQFVFITSLILCETTKLGIWGNDLRIDFQG